MVLFSSLPQHLLTMAAHSLCSHPHCLPCQESGKAEQPYLVAEAEIRQGIQEEAAADLVVASPVGEVIDHQHQSVVEVVSQLSASFPPAWRNLEDWLDRDQEGGGGRNTVSKG